MVKRHNHFKIGINGQELLHYRSGESKSIFVDVQNPSVLPPFNLFHLKLNLQHFFC